MIEDDKAGGDNHTDDREEISEGIVTDIDYRFLKEGNLHQ